MNAPQFSGFTHESPVNKTSEWYTPPYIFQDIGLQFDLDPCHPKNALPWVPAKERYWKEIDGFTKPWFGRVWCNPPYGAETAKWLARMGEHNNGMALVFARTDTEWFEAARQTATAFLFIKGRIKFVDESGRPPRTIDKKTGKMKESGPGAGSMLIAWGDDCAAALQRMADKDIGFFTYAR